MEEKVKRLLVQKEVIRVAVVLYKSGKTMTHQDLVEHINRTFPNLYEYPYEHMGKVLHVAFGKCQTEYEKAAVASVFTDKYGNPLVKE